MTEGLLQGLRQVRVLYTVYSTQSREDTMENKEKGWVGSQFTIIICVQKQAYAQKLSL